VGPRAGLDTAEENNSQPLPGLEPPIIQPVAQPYTTELYRVPSCFKVLSYYISGLIVRYFMRSYQLRKLFGVQLYEMMITYCKTKNTGGETVVAYFKCIPKI
jgi:hypothetical protein